MAMYAVCLLKNGFATSIKRGTQKNKNGASVSVTGELPQQSPSRHSVESVRMREARANVCLCPTRNTCWDNRGQRECVLMSHQKYLLG